MTGFYTDDEIYDCILVRNAQGHGKHSGIPWMVRLVRPGQRYGRDDYLIHGQGSSLDDPLVEFFDRRQDTDKFGPMGQFVSRYYRDTLLNHSPMLGLQLDAGVDPWFIEAQPMRMVLKWLLHTWKVEQTDYHQSYYSKDNA